MKVMISKPNIDIKDINKDSFYALCNNNNSPIKFLLYYLFSSLFILIFLPISNIIPMALNSIQYDLKDGND